METAPNADQRHYWDKDTGGIWADEADAVEAAFGVFNPAILAAAGLRPGFHVLDIGCGNGALTRAAASAVGPDGAVTGIDVSDPMLTVARGAPPTPEAAPIIYLKADAQTHAFQPQAANAVVSRMGVMFFDEPVAAFANLRAAAAPNARFAAITWRRIPDATWFGIGVAAVTEVLGPPERPDPFAPGPMAFAETDRVTGILTEAGWQSASGAPVPFKLRPGGGMDGTIDMMLRFSPAGRAVRDRPDEPALRDAMIDALRRQLKPFSSANGVEIP
ncbi:MAG: class I SAM-dependent methyltransferase, partial [Pseudomonadota bacterium]